MNAISCQKIHNYLNSDELIFGILGVKLILRRAELLKCDGILEEVAVLHNNLLGNNAYIEGCKECETLIRRLTKDEDEALFYLMYYV